MREGGAGGNLVPGADVSGADPRDIPPSGEDFSPDESYAYPNTSDIDDCLSRGSVQEPDCDSDDFFSGSDVQEYDPVRGELRVGRARPGRVNLGVVERPRRDVEERAVSACPFLDDPEAVEVLVTIGDTAQSVETGVAPLKVGVVEDWWGPLE